eukprot:CAMPEP_0197035312 /NCGR_PEP_ID=MMETSP1384-20130603/13156_1 /TAXON_ID=29189 /ORGANISM="Ammonia sp." /LENGTH=352 /DNA_ID=CAMNT_0042465359 /DNA_START=20 /DNA_END=1078 /DNA_ORIENTATION=+
MAANAERKKNWTKVGALLVSAALAYTYYRQKSKASSPDLDRLKATDLKNLRLNTANVEVPKDIDEYLSIALSAAYEAGETIKKFIDDKSSKSHSVLQKSSHTDLCTQIDKQCEELILSKIRSSFPTHKIIAEESCVDPTRHDITDEFTWFVDPIDGTTNFFHGLPYVAVCIGLRVNKVPILGVVHCPILNETFHAILGRGAYLIRHATEQKVKLQTNPVAMDNDDVIKQAMVLTEVAYDRSEKWVKCLNRRLCDLLYRKKVRSVRMLGSCAMNMCFVACGRADIFFEGRNNVHGPKPWDYTAAEIIVHEAGGVTCDPEGRQFDCTQGRVLCCNHLETAKYVIGLHLYTPQDQ